MRPQSAVDISFFITSIVSMALSCWPIFWKCFQHRKQNKIGDIVIYGLVHKRIGSFDCLFWWVLRHISKYRSHSSGHKCFIKMKLVMVTEYDYMYLKICMCFTNCMILLPRKSVNRSVIEYILQYCMRMILESEYYILVKRTHNFTYTCLDSV